jgi:excisionase family DNA binding protein
MAQAPDKAKATPANIRKRAKDVDEFGATYGLGRNSVYNEIASGALQSIKVGRRRLITESQEDQWLRRKESAA